MRGRSNFPLTNSSNSEKFHPKIYISINLLNNLIQLNNNNNKKTISAQIVNIRNIRLTGGKYYEKV